MPCSPDALLTADQTPPKSPRSFAHGTVGLGIVAAMSAAAADSKMIAAPPRSEPIPITSPRPRRAGWKDAGDADEEEELSESYTCVISHVAGSKQVYFDDGSDGVRYNYGASPGCSSSRRRRSRRWSSLIAATFARRSFMDSISSCTEVIKPSVVWSADARKNC